jgi:FAD/FMN-containing dehydrogenase
MENVTAMTRAGTEVELPAQALDGLASRLEGELLTPGAPGYAEACAVWNGMIDRSPALIARCAGEDDVVAAVNVAREHGLLLAVRGGGHGVAGHALCEGGLVIDLSTMRDVEVDPQRRVARAGGGCTLGDLDAATQRHGLATPLGVVTETGIAGLTLSGGMGWLRRKHGLSCDNVVSARVVTAAGSVLTASEDENEDLFWALRGGGGNFGVVTSFEYRLHPIGPEAMFCYVLYPARSARDVLRACEERLAELPDLGPIGVLGQVPEVPEIPAERHGEPFVAILGMYPGDPEEGERALVPLRELAEPIADFSGVMPYTEAQAVLDEDYPDGWRYYWKSVNVAELGDEVIDGLVGHAAAAPSPHSTIDVWFQGGAMAAVGEQDTAFANRSAPYLIGVEANWEPGSGPDDRQVAWVRQVVDDMRPFSRGGVYLNFPGFLEEGEQLLRDGYGANLERLVEVKTRYDPDNLFRLNANIPPRG